MKKLLLRVILMGFVFLFVQGVAQATSFTFTDNINYWPTWSNGSDDNLDFIGHPNITGGSGKIENGYLTELYFDYLNSASLVAAGDVFIDVGSDGFWDYVIVSDADTPNNTNVDPGLAQGVYEVTSSFSSQKGVNDNYYLLSNKYHSFSYREDHPVTASGSAPLNPIDSSISFTDFSKNFGANGQVKFEDLDGIYVGTSNYFTIGFGPTCANDEVYTPIHVPEPATALMLGFGLLGLGFCSSRKLRKKVNFT